MVERERRKREDTERARVVAVAPAAEHIDSSLYACDASAPTDTEGNWLEMVEQAQKVPCASRSGAVSTENPLQCYTVIVIITKAQQKERQLPSWRAWRWVNWGRRMGKRMWKGIGC